MKTGIVLKVRGVKYPVSLDEAGQFHASADGHACAAATLKELETKLAGMTKVQLSIRFGRPEQVSYKPGDVVIRTGTVTGIHKTQQTLLVKWDDGHRESLRSYQARNQFRELTAQEAAEYGELVSAQLEAKRKMDEFVRAHTIDLWETANTLANPRPGTDDEESR